MIVTQNLEYYDRFFLKTIFDNYSHYAELESRDRVFVLEMFLKEFNKHLRKQISNFDTFEPVIVIVDFLNIEKDELEEMQIYEMCQLYQDAIELVLTIYGEID